MRRKLDPLHISLSFHIPAHISTFATVHQADVRALVQISKLANRGFAFGFEFESTVETDGVSVGVHYTRPLAIHPPPPPAAGPSNSISYPAAATGAAAAAHEVGLPHISKALAEPREFVYESANESANQWASSAGTSLEANLKHITVTLATWDAVWELYLAELFMKCHNLAKQLVVFFGAAGIGTRGGWGADAVLRACCKVGCWPASKDQRQSRVVLVDKHHTSRISSAVNGQQPCEEQLNHEQPTRPAGWKPPAVASRKPPQPSRNRQAATQPAASELGPSTPPPAKRSKNIKAEQAAGPMQPTKGKGKGKAAKAKPAPQSGRWLGRDCNAALNMQRIGESRWRPLELCWWPDQKALPAKGKEYPELGYKRVRDRPPRPNSSRLLRHNLELSPGMQQLTEASRKTDSQAAPWLQWEQPPHQAT
ncbi:hypothetical protein QJQ45_004251 [Haematococcus lacustris]|nr:hypothetical protein QJQ45_004251 [Haematococcus lacustris]